MSTSRNTPGEAAAVELLGQSLSARSVIASLLLGRRPPRARSALLVRWCSLFGVGEGTARVALSRMVERGELRVDDGTYELAGRVRGRQREQATALAGPEPWTGEWTLWVVHPGARSAGSRAALRSAAERARLALLREGAWTRPANLPPGAVEPDDRAVLEAASSRWDGRPADDPVGLVAALFPVVELQQSARHLAERLARVQADLERPHVDDEALAVAFVVGSAVLRHLRRDPLLPDELVGPTIGGAPSTPSLRAAYPAYERAFGRAVAAWWDRAGPARDSRA